MAGVTLADRVSSEEIARRCGVQPVFTVVKERRLKWFDHVKRRKGEGLLREVMKLVPGVKPRERPRKQWKNYIEEDLKEMNLRETDSFDPRRLESSHQIVKPSSIDNKTLIGES